MRHFSFVKAGKRTIKIRDERLTKVCMVQTIARFRIEFSAAKGYLLPGVLRVRKTGLYQHHQFPLGVLVGRVVAKFACPASC